jgi:hypothetical protein
MNVRLTRFLLLVAFASCLASARFALADFSGTPITFKVDGGWSWFQDPRAIITNNQLIIGSVAGVTVAGGTGQTAGDVTVVNYDLTKQTLSSPFLLANLPEHDDHDTPAFAVLPDGRVLTTYETHGSTNNVLWRVSSAPGQGIGWGAQQTSAVNVTSDGNGNTYSNPFYLSTPGKLVNFSRAIGYDPNYSMYSNLSATVPTFTYGGHWMYWQNPNNGVNRANGGNGRPYLKYASNGKDTVWFANTEDSPDNYNNSLYVGYIKFDASGNGTVFNSTGTQLGGLSTGTAPTGNGANPPVGGNQGDIASGTGVSFLPTDFTRVLQTNVAANNMTGKAVSWASDFELDSSGKPYAGIVVRNNLTDAVGANTLEYYFAHLIGSTWQVSRLGFGGAPLYSGQPNYAGLIALDSVDPNKLYISSNVDPTTGATLLGPDSLQHWQIFMGTSFDDGLTWSWNQLTNTATDNVRPIIALGSGFETLLWMRGTYTTYLNYNTNVVGLIQVVPEPSTLALLLLAGPGFLLFRRRPLRKT